MMVTNLMSAVAAASQLNLTLIETASRLERIRTKLHEMKAGNSDVSK
jgi:phage tail tape-measure protein